jgi:signal transduction histidine kinase
MADANLINALQDQLNLHQDWQDLVLNALDHLESGLVMYGPDDVLVFCNRRFKEIYPEIADILIPGTPYAEIARTFYQREYHHHTDQSEDEYVLNRVNKHLEPDEIDYEYWMKEGTCILSSDRKTKNGGIIGFRLDISERKIAEQRLAETEMRIMAELEKKVAERTHDLQMANQHLAKAMSELKNTQHQLVQSEKLASLGYMVAGVAHEISTPIGNALLVGTGIVEEVANFSSMCKERVTRSGLDRHIQTLTQGSSVLVSNLERAGKLVQGFRQLALDRATEQRRTFFLHSIIDEVLIAMGPSLKRTPFKLNCDISPELQLDSFPGPLGQVIVNLITNALHHGFEGRSHGNIHIQAQLYNEDQIEILFSDDGIGMSEHTIEHVFDPFFTTKLGQGGNGLGMHIVYNICTQLLAGEISVRSEPNAGTCWRILIPCTAP